MFHRVVTICWITKRQIAMYDCLRVAQSQGFLDFIGLDPPNIFSSKKETLLVFGDNSS